MDSAIHAGDQFWAQSCERLGRQLTREQFVAWVKPISAGAYDADARRLTLLAPNRTKAEHFRNEYLREVQSWTDEFFGHRVDLNLEIGSAPVQNPQSNASTLSADESNPGPASLGSLLQGAADGLALGNHAQASTSQAQLAAAAQAAAIDVQERTRVNTALRFDNFVSGKANQLARAAALQVADNPGVSYNPFFLYGGTGLGKTHLIHAIGNAMLDAKPDARVRYIHAEQYVADVVRAYQRKDFDAFKRYYHSLDLLLIDDIQFFAGKERTQEEFFYLFEALTAAKSQIIITSDTYPKELSDIDERLKSRFDAGLTVAIEPPELEMRVAILQQKAEELGKLLESEVAFFIAKHLRSNVRELEGALKKVVAYCDFHGKTITLDTAKDALRDLLQVSRGQISIEVIQKTVADYYKIKVADMYSKRRPANIAVPRQVAMYLAKELTQKSLPEIGELFGGRDHTTVLHAVRKIGTERGKDAQLNHTLHVLEQTLKS
ncbi:MAG TPA: chromosomal replication initiator protein DnaA [Burkholderiaceae bacterium]|nr:chromosomal replication initiator protein DnaA [Burkholderiaceae bacterium]